MRYEVRELDLSGILDQAIALLKNHFGVLFGIVAAVFLPVAIAFALLQVALFENLGMVPQPNGGPPPNPNAFLEGSGPWILGAFGVLAIVHGLIVAPLTQAAIVDSVARFYLGQDVAIGGSLRRAVGRLPALIGTWLLIALAMMAGFLPVFLGALVNSIPVLVVGTIIAIVVMVMFYFWFALATQVVVVEKRAGPGALGRSRFLMKGNMLKLFVLVLITGFIGAGIQSVAAVVPNQYVQAVFQIFGQSVAMLLGAAVTVVLYFSARCQHEDFDLVLLARSVDVDYDAGERDLDEDAFE